MQVSNPAVSKTVWLLVTRCGTLIYFGPLAQLVEQETLNLFVASSILAGSTIYGRVAQLVRALACHARGRRFEPGRGRHIRRRNV